LQPLIDFANNAIVPVNSPGGILYPGCVQNELPLAANTCFSNNEKATVWFKFQIGPLQGGPTAIGSPAGKLRFKIVPKDVLDLPNYDPITDLGNTGLGNMDYDFLLFDVTNNYLSNGTTCSAIKNSTTFTSPTSLIRSCNWTGTRGPTGLFEPGVGTESAAGPATRFNKPLSVNVGQIFYLAIDNFSIGQSGFLLDFRGIEAPDDSTSQLFSPDFDVLNSNVILGIVFRNSNNDCIQDPNETGLRRRVLVTEPGSTYTLSDNLGNYKLNASAGNHVVKQIPNELLGLLETQNCPPTNGNYPINFANSSGDTAKNKNFANELILCPLLKIGVGSNQRRRCVRNHTTITAWNNGTIPSGDQTRIYLKLPRFIHLISADKPFTFNEFDSTYVFNVGPIPAQGSFKIKVIDSVACLPGLMNIQQCTKVWITPPNTCFTNSPAWDGVDVAIRASCDGTLPRFVIQNTGAAMSSARPYQVFVDSVLAYVGYAQLGSNDSLSFVAPVSGNNRVRVEMAQSPQHPFSTFMFGEIQCLPLSQNRISFSPIHGTPESDVDCMPIRDSYDPNDKQVQPQGITNEGRIAPNHPLEYKIRFQNTGNDIAYRVVVVDTLNEFFDLSTFEELGSSHAYVLSIGGRGKPVLRFTFDNINLPDSLSDPDGSQGFIRFRIRPKANAPLGTRLKNHGEIYFDFNYPIITNQTLNTIYEPQVVSGILDSIIVLGVEKSEFNKNEIALIPNPNSGRFEAKSTQLSSLKVFSIEGKELFKSQEPKTKHIVDLTTFGKGCYFIEFMGVKGRFVRKLIVE